MKKVIGFGLVMLLAVPAMAQFMGLPVAGGRGCDRLGHSRHRAGWCSVMISTCTACGERWPCGRT